MTERAGDGKVSRCVALWLASMLVLVGVTGGCSDNDPAIALRRAGAVIEQDEDRERIEKITLPQSAGDPELAEVGQLARVVELDLSGTLVTDAGLVHLENLDELKTLDLSNTNVTDNGLKSLKSLTGLKTLTLSNTRISAKGLIEHIPGFPALSTLVLTPAVKPQPPVGGDGSWLKRLFSGVKLGIDLAGGANLVLQVDEVKATEQQKELTKSVMAQMATAINKRANPGGNKELTVRPLGTNRIEVIIPRADPQVVEQTKRMMTRLGSLELATLANGRDHPTLVSRARDPQLQGNQIRNAEGVLEGQWHPVDPNGQVDGSYDVQIMERSGSDGNQVDHVLVMYEPETGRVTGDHLYRVYETTDDSGRLAVGFTLNMAGSNRFSDLTGKNEPTADKSFYRRLAIVLDGNVFSAPRLESRISSNGIISGDFTKQEINELIGVLDAGALEVPLLPEPVSELSISPTLGEDVQNKGVMAIGIAALTVIVFMFIYYRLSGLVAIVCLLLNLVLVLGTMIFIEATFTLPGLAGLVLTIGMAVDANVLIFERIREEQRRGGAVRMAIQNGFARALTTIVDANVTTLLVAAVLYAIGTDQVRGFAVTLFIGIVMSMFTALYVGRLLFDVWESRKHRERIQMNSLPGISGREFNFIGHRTIAACVSVLVIVVGMTAFFYRGVNNLDIDFRGGRAVSFQFREAHDSDDVKEKLEQVRAANFSEEFDDSFTLEKLTQIEDEAGAEAVAAAGSGFPFRLRTTTKAKEGDDDQRGTSRTESVNEKIQSWIAESFKDDSKFRLTTMSVDFDTVREITDAANKDFFGGHQAELNFGNADKVARENVVAYVAGGLEKGLALANLDPTAIEGRFEVEPLEDDKRAETALNWVVRFRPIVVKADVVKALEQMKSDQDGTPRFDEVTSFDSAVAVEMQNSALLAMLFSLVAIVAYIWFRFQRIDFGLAAVVALVHDVMVVLGGVSLAGLAASQAGWEGGLLQLQDFKINLPMIAAFLTIVGYSLNDTIVVFDRIREVRGKNPSLTPEMVNLSLNQTLSRTLLTSLTTFIVVVILYFGGGDGIHGFAFCLVMGVVVGTYSSIFVASPALLWMMNPDSAFHRFAGQILGTKSQAPRRSTATHA